MKLLTIKKEESYENAKKYKTYVEKFKDKYGKDIVQHIANIT